MPTRPSWTHSRWAHEARPLGAARAAPVRAAAGAGGKSLQVPEDSLVHALHFTRTGEGIALAPRSAKLMQQLVHHKFLHLGCLVTQALFAASSRHR